MDKAGVERSIIQGWYWQNPDTAKEQNKQIAKFIKQHPDRLSAFAAVCPDDLKSSQEIISHAREDGFVGLGEVHPEVQKFSVSSSSFKEFCDMAAGEKLPLCIHITKREDREYVGKANTDNAAIINAAAKYKNTNFILAHWAGSEIFSEDFNPDTFPENLYIDSATSPLLHDSSVWMKACKLFCKKVVFGSDYPLRLYPKRFKEEELESIVGEAKENVPQNCAEDVFHLNIERLIS